MNHILTSALLAAILVFLPAIATCEPVAASMPLCEDYDCLMGQGLQQLEYRNPEAAKTLFRKAKKNKAHGKDKTKKAAADRMMEKCKDYYPAIFKNETDAEASRGAGAFLACESKLKNNLTLARNNALQVVEEAREYDQGLIDAITSQIVEVKRDRMAAIEKTIAHGDELLEKKEFAAALGQFEYLDQETDVTEKNTHEVTRRLRDARYGVAFMEGEAYLISGECELAHGRFNEAQTINNTLEVRGKVTGAAACAHDELIGVGNSLLTSGNNENCLKAHQAFVRALYFKSNSADALQGKGDAAKCHAEFLLAEAASLYEGKDYNAVAKKLAEAEEFHSQVENSAGQGIAEIRDGYGTALFTQAQRAMTNYRSQKVEIHEVETAFRVVGLFKDKEQMTKESHYLHVFRKAEDLYSKRSKFEDVEAFEELDAAWKEVIAQREGVKYVRLDSTAKEAAAARWSREANEIDVLMRFFAKRKQAPNLANAKSLAGKATAFTVFSPFRTKAKREAEKQTTRATQTGN